MKNWLKAFGLVLGGFSVFVGICLLAWYFPAIFAGLGVSCFLVFVAVTVKGELDRAEKVRRRTHDFDS